MTLQNSLFINNETSNKFITDDNNNRHNNEYQRQDNRLVHINILRVMSTINRYKDNIIYYLVTGD